MQDIIDQVKRFIIDDLGWEGSADELTAELPLIGAGALDSIGILTMVQFLESHYGILIEDGEIVSAHLNSLASIERYVQSKILSQSTAGILTAGYAERLETVAAHRPRGIAEIDLAGRRVLQYHRASPDDAVLGNRLTLRDAAAGAEEGGASHPAAVADGDMCAQVAVVLHDGPVAQAGAAAQKDVGAGQGPVLHYDVLLHERILADLHVRPDNSMAARVRDAVESGCLDGMVQTPPDAVQLREGHRDEHAVRSGRIGARQLPERHDRETAVGAVRDERLLGAERDHLMRAIVPEILEGDGGRLPRPDDDDALASWLFLQPMSCCQPFPRVISDQALNAAASGCAGFPE